ncbi:MAG: carboxypeptidase regulatory-like domain-containing protein, partial [Thermoanaerobaculia bacterium]|nr:carboxypeptidase regulatory-like domain-containing protein [Thermoanaerobaculia bacterium]
RRSNGWGFIEVPGGRDQTDDGEPIFYRAQVLIQGTLQGAPPTIDTSIESQNIEINDTIRWNDWSFNVGVVLSEDTLWGQGLREDPSASSGFVPEFGNRYEMYQVSFEDQIQPRIGATWAYDGLNTVYASYAKYNPIATSLPRAASWDRRLTGRIANVYFDENGDVLEVAPRTSSSGKLFQPDMDPRSIDEFMVGTSRRVNQNLTARAYARYRYGQNFWEDTNNNARVRFNPPEGVPQELYIPTNNLVGEGSYVIAQLDGAFTKYYEVSLESDWNRDNLFIRGSYTWSHYYGNFDQDNTTTGNDANIFIGSSFIADGFGHQVWDNRYGNLKGDRRHVLKLYGTYSLPWNATAGAFGVYQSGEAWEAWDGNAYRGGEGPSAPGWAGDTAYFAEPAGSRTGPSHYQIDLNYTQNFNVLGDYTIQVAADVFNITDNQTGYAIQNKVNERAFGEPRRFYDPRRWQVALRFLF